MKTLMTFFSVLVFAVPLLAENTLTLPSGRFRARIKPIYAFSFTTQYNNLSAEESLVSQFKKELDVSTAQKLSPQLAFAMSMLKIQSLGNFEPSLKASTLVVGSAIEYGLTENLTIGFIAPVIAANTTFDLKFNKTLEAAVHPAFANRDFQKDIRDIAAAKGYNYVKEWENFGLGDIEIGLKYRLLNTNSLALATKTGFRLPTGKSDDPDLLTDIPLGDGQTDVGSTLLLDYRGIPHTLLTGMAKYTVQLADHQLLRVPDDGEFFTNKKENIKRNLGDRFDTSLTAEVSLLDVFNINTTYSFFRKEKDRFTSNLGYYAKGLEKNTAQQKHSADIGIGFSTLPWFKEGSFTFPMDAGINVEVPLTGKNVAKVTTVNLEYKLYF